MSRKVYIVLEFEENEWEDYTDTVDEFLVEDSGIYEGLKIGVTANIVENAIVLDKTTLPELLKDEFGESITEDGDENNPLDWWFQDVTVDDVVNFLNEQSKNK